MRWRSVLQHSACMLAMLVVGTGIARWSCAQSAAGAGDSDARYSFAFVGVPLSEALDQLINATRISLIYEPQQVTGARSSCKAQQATTDQVLRCILAGTDFDFVRLSSGTYVLIADPKMAPATGGLAGLVRDALTGEPLADVSIVLADAQTGTATNRDGRFALTDVASGPQALLVTHLAYQPQVDTVFVEPGSPLRLDLALQPRILFTDPIIVSGVIARLPSEALVAERQQPAALRAPIGLGSADLVQNLSTVAGVTLGAALSDVHIQGGDISEQQFRLDGVPVFMPVSNGGFIGPFSPFAVSQVTIRKAGFGAAHGSGLSGVIDITQRLAPTTASGLAVQIDPLSVNGRWNGRLRLSNTLRATWMAAGRQSLWGIHQPTRVNKLFRQWAVPDLFLSDALANGTEAPSEATADDPLGPVDLDVRDAHVAVHIHSDGLRSLRVAWYRGRNGFGVDHEAADGEVGQLLETGYDWQNDVLQARYEWVQHRRLFFHADAWRTTYALRHPLLPADIQDFLENEDAIDEDETPVDELASQAEEFNALNEYGLRLGGDWAAARQHHVTGDIAVTHTTSGLRIALNPRPDAQTDGDALQPHQWRVAAFVEDRWALSHRTTLTLGTRLTWLPEHLQVYTEPRLALQHDRPVGLNRAWALTAAVGRYHQFLHAFDVATYNVTALLPRVRFWMPVGTAQRPPEAYHATAGALYRIGETWQLGAEAYYKHQPHLLVLNHTAADPDDPLARASGRAYGLTVRMDWTHGRHRFDAHYTLGRAERRIAGRYDGAMLPMPWDAPHRLHAMLNIALHAHWELSVRGQGTWGRRWGFRQGYYDYLSDTNSDPFDLNDPTAHRLPAYLQLDLGFAYKHTLGATRVAARLAVINATGRNNVTDWSLDFDNDTDLTTMIPRYAVPFLPSLSLRIQR